jgi:hypothetical protein
VLELLVDTSVSDLALDFGEDLVDALHDQIVVLARFAVGEDYRRIVEVVVDEFAGVVDLLDCGVDVLVYFVVQSHRVFIEHVF